MLNNFTIQIISNPRLLPAREVLDSQILYLLRTLIRSLYKLITKSLIVSLTENIYSDFSIYHLQSKQFSIFIYIYLSKLWHYVIPRFIPLQSISTNSIKQSDSTNSIPIEALNLKTQLHTGYCIAQLSLAQYYANLDSYSLAYLRLIQHRIPFCIAQNSIQHIKEYLS